jgi:hypothetical protein
MCCESANNAERSAAEPAEPRAGTKGNANQQHMARTQSRETVSQELACIGQTARQRKKERLTTLFHHINVELLRDAFSGIKPEAAPAAARWGLGFWQSQSPLRWTPPPSRDRNVRGWRCVRFFQCFSHVSPLVTPGSRTLRPTTALRRAAKLARILARRREGSPEYSPICAANSAPGARPEGRTSANVLRSRGA